MKVIWLLLAIATPCLASAPPVAFGGRQFELPDSPRLNEIDRVDRPARVIYELPESGERYVVIRHRPDQPTDDAALLFARGYILAHIERFESERQDKVGLLVNANYGARKAPAILVATSTSKRGEELCHHSVVMRSDGDVILLAHEGTSKQGLVFLAWAQKTLRETYGLDIPTKLMAVRQRGKS